MIQNTCYAVATVWFSICIIASIYELRLKRQRLAIDKMILNALRKQGFDIRMKFELKERE